MNQNLNDIFDLEIELLIKAILLKYQYDFSHYSRSSIKRRLQVCLNRLNISSMSELQNRILHDARFFSVILGYLTVNTTSMFRDPEYFKLLRTEVVPYLKTYPSLKVWIAGCSTGEEVYSLSIVLHEEGVLNKTLIYATDINPNNLEKAKRGIYDSEEVKKATVHYQKSGGRASFSDYYTAAYGACQFDSRLVKNVLFSDHSLSTDSVFAEVNFVSCRNVLIYFEKDLQDRAIGLFYDSLVSNGYLGLGSKESLHFSAYKNKFHQISHNERLYQKLGGINEHKI